MATGDYEDGEIPEPKRERGDGSGDEIGEKRKHKSKKEKSDSPRAKRHKDEKEKKEKKEKKDKKHKKDSDSDGGKDKEERKASPKREERKASPKREERKPSPARRRSYSRSRSRSRDRPRRRSPSPRRGYDRRSPPRRGGKGGYDRRDDRYRRDDRGRDGRDGGRRESRREEPRITEERRQDELKKEKEREEAEKIRKAEEDAAYAKKVAEDYERMKAEGGVAGDDDDDDSEDEETREERERQERKAKWAAAAAAKKEAEEKERAANPNPSPPPMEVEVPESEPAAMVAITPRAKGQGQVEDSDEDDDQPTEEEKKEGGRKGDVFNMFNDTEEIAMAKVKAKQNRGDNLLDKENFDDEEGYLTFAMGEVFHERYEVTKVLGKGVFSTVLQGKDLKFPAEQTKDKKPVMAAIKIIRNNDMMAKASAKELEFLKLLTKDGGADKHHIVALNDHFVHHGHMCLVFEPMDMNLREVIKKFGHNRGINIEGVQVFAKQMLQALKHIRKCKIVHADIKPDNILINERHNAIKICDFGSGSYINECDITPYLVSRWYRAPEITLCLKYDYSIDLWSIASCLYELYTGKVMFPGNSNNDMLRRFMETKGRFPNKLIRRSMTKMIELGRPVDFTEDFKFIRVMIDKITKKEMVKVLTIDEKPVKDLLKLLMPTKLQPDQERKVKQLNDLLHAAMALNPDNRASIEECLAHPFVKEPFGFVPKRREPAAAAPPMTTTL